MAPSFRSDSPLAVRYLELRYDPQDSDASALRLIHSLFPEWQLSEGPVEFVRFTDGITNTLLKAQKRRPGYSQEQIDREAVLLRAYGQGTDVLIDREREIRAHSLLASKGLAPTLFARFTNGLLYKFIAGNVCSPQDIPRPQIYRAVAEKLGHWHGTLSIAVLSDWSGLEGSDQVEHVTGNCTKSDMPTPSIWSVTQSWINALPAESDKQRSQIHKIQSEFDFLKAKLAKVPGIFGTNFVFAHCDLLLGNVIIAPSTANGLSNGSSSPNSKVHFIDYEYSTPAPAAFDIANHFAEWAGMNCDYNAIPTRSTRRDFIEHYVKSYSKFSNSACDGDSVEAAVDQLCTLVDLHRGMPGFFWGVWSLIQAQISQIHFDYASYAEERFSEYYAWKAELDGSRAQQGREMPLRERRWTHD